jgi:hypothetical protein
MFLERIMLTLIFNGLSNVHGTSQSSHNIH